MNTQQAKCYCGNISAEVRFSKPVSAYEPRACDCDFCEKHAAAYVSDSSGSMNIHVQNGGHLGSYQHGSGLASFLFCQNCGVMFAVTCTIDQRTFGSLNSRTLDSRKILMPAQTASPKLLSDSEKLARWAQVWFADITLTIAED